MKIFSKIDLGLCALIMCGVSAAAGDSAKPAPAKVMPVRSVFVMPTSPTEGRDPFFPQSTRVYEVANASAPVAAHVDEITTLKVKGYIIVNGQAMVTINNHSFMVGDEGDVLTSNGRVHIRCLAIRGGTAVIEAGGQRIDLHF